MRITQDNKIVSSGEVETACIYLLRKMQNDLCACGVSLSNGYQLAHKRYGLDITLYDLELKCGACHALEHGTKSFTGTLRTF